MAASNSRLLLAAFFCACATAGDASALETVNTPGAFGADVVHSVVSMIQRSNIFPPDNEFLRRIAFVESKDGTARGTYRRGYHGGIWQVDLIGFQAIQDTESHPRLARRFNQIRRVLGIEWRLVQWKDLRKPLFSGLAARLFLSNIPAAIPAANDVLGQAQYWKRFYNTYAGAGTVDKFVRDVSALRHSEGTYFKGSCVWWNSYFPLKLLYISPPIYCAGTTSVLRTT